MTDTNPDTILALTADIVVAHVSNGNVAASDLPALIATVHSALVSLGQPVAAPEPEYVRAVTVAKSLANPDRIVSMIDGRGYSSLKRHLGTHGITPAEYRARYKLAADYPMVAAGYSAKRSALALASGLGRK